MLTLGLSGRSTVVCPIALLCAALSAAVGHAEGPRWGGEEIVQADGHDLVVTGYSVPSLADWDEDGRPDLIVGEGGGGWTGMVRIYRNVGSAAAPAFSEPLYAELSSGADLTVTPGGCLGAFPRLACWDADANKDLIIGQADGTVRFCRNVGTDAAPAFEAGTLLEVGPAGGKTPLDVGSRAAPCLVDWDGDGRRDLLVGAADGKLRLYRNQGTAGEPDFPAVEYLADAAGGSDLLVSTGRSSPDVADLDGDGRKDLLVGNTYGQLLLYVNQGPDADPSFSSAHVMYLEADGVRIDLAGSARSRPCLADWTGDGLLDLLVGADDGKVRLYQGVPEPASVLVLAAVAVPIVLRRRP